MPVLKETHFTRIVRENSTLGKNPIDGIGGNGFRVGRTYLVQRNETCHMSYKTWGTRAGFAALRDSVEYAAMLDVRMERELLEAEGQDDPDENWLTKQERSEAEQLDEIR